MAENELVLRRLQDCTVRIVLADGTYGSGFFIAQGRIATAVHVVQRLPVTQVQVHWKGFVLTPTQIELPAQFLSDLSVDELLDEGDDNPDVALVCVDIESHPCAFLESSVELGDALYTFGYSDEHPEGDPTTTVFEGFSSNHRSFKLKQGQIRPGISGSPILNLSTGGVCGMISMSRDCKSDMGGRGIPAHVIFGAFRGLHSAARHYHLLHSEWFIDLNSSQRARLEDDRTGVVVAQQDHGSLTAALLTSPRSRLSDPERNQPCPFRPVGPSYAVIKDLVLDAQSGTLWAGTSDMGVFASPNAEIWRPRDLGLPVKEINGLALSGDRRKLYAAAERGLWISDDYGWSWTEADPRFQHSEVLCMVTSPNDPELQIVGTLKFGGVTLSAMTVVTVGPLSESSSVDHGHAHFSTDGGKTWKTWPVETINAAAISDSDTRVAYIASADGGLYVTKDGCKTLRRVSTFPKDQKPLAVGIAPGDPQVVLVGTLEGGVWTTRDGAQSWQHIAITRCDQVSGFAFSPSNDQQVLAAARSGVFQSNDGGHTWFQSNAGLDYSWAAAVRFGPDGVAYVGTSGGGVYYRRSGQVNWTRRNHGFPTVPAVVSHPLTVDRWLVGTGIGLYETEDGGASWKFLSRPGETITALAARELTPSEDTVVAPGLHISTSGGVAYASPEGNGSYEIWWGTASGCVYRARENEGYELVWEFRGEYGGAGIRSLVLGLECCIVVVPEGLPIHMSRDDGLSWEGIANSVIGELVNGVFASSSEPGTMYAATVDRGMFVTTDSGEHWSKCDLRLSAPVTWVAESGPQPGTVYIATMAGDILRSSPKSDNYSIIRHGHAGDTKWAVVLPDPRDPNLVISASQERVNASKDGGLNWSCLSLGSADVKCHINHIARSEQVGSPFLFASTAGLFALDADTLIEILAAKATRSDPK